MTDGALYMCRWSITYPISNNVAMATLTVAAKEEEKFLLWAIGYSAYGYIVCLYITYARLNTVYISTHTIYYTIIIILG